MVDNEVDVVETTIEAEYKEVEPSDKITTKEPVETVRGDILLNLTELDNILVNNCIKTIYNMHNISIQDSIYSDIVYKYLSILQEEGYIIDMDMAGAIPIYTFNYNNIINNIHKLKKIINEYGDELDTLKTFRYTGVSNNNTQNIIKKKFYTLKYNKE